MSVSGQSASSFGSGVESETSQKGPGNGNDDTLDDNTHTFEAGLFGVLFTVSKEKAPSVGFVAFRLFMDWIQVFLLMVNPVYGWSIDPNNKGWQAFSFIQLNYFMSVRGYTFFLICMYILAVALAANLGLCIWVSNSFKNNKFDHVWPIVWLRYFSLVFYQVLDVASLTLFLMTMDCGYFPGPTQGMNQEFPDVQCWQMPHMIHIAVAAASIAIFFVLAVIFTMAEIELNPVSKNLMGMAHTKAEVWGFGVKMAMTCITVFVNETRWMSTFLLIGSFVLCYLYLMWLPHLHAVVNHIRVGSYFSVFWASLLYIIMAYTPGVGLEDYEGIARFQDQCTTALWAGFIPFGLLGGYFSWLRTRYFEKTVVTKFRDAPTTVKAKHIYKFTDPRQVEIVSRCCRKWVDEDTLEEEGVNLAERVIKAGMQQLPRQPYMVIWWSSFLIDVQGSYQSGYAALQDAKKMPNPSFLERFCIFIREQEHTQKASAASSGDNANVDLVSYVEFQRNYRLAMRLHLDALLAKKNFWETLLHNQVTFDKLSAAVQRIEVTVRASERMYRQVLARHSNSVKILVLYVKFLQNVRNDPWSAARWSAEAEKLQKLEEEANERAVFGDGGGQHGGLQNHDDSKGVIIMGANCLIRMINEPAATLFGYGQRAELVGKNINLIVPPPFSRNHNNYVRNYIQTGNAKILDQLREFVALHKDRYVVPINVFVTKVSGIGEDSVFMGIFQPVPPLRNTATLWILNGGMVLSCDGDFTDWLGYKHEDIHAKPVTDMVVNKSDLDDLMTQMRQETQAAMLRKPAINAADPNSPGSGTPSSWTARNLIFRHLYLDAPVTVDGTIRVGGIGETALWVLKLTRKADSEHYLMVSDVKGRITHVTSHLAHKLGTTVSKLQSGNMVHALDALLPVPYMRIHHQWYREKVDIPPAWSCRSGLSMCLAGVGPEGPTMLPFSLKFSKKECVGKEALNLVEFEEKTMEEMLDQRRLTLVLNSQGVITQAGNSPVSLYGFESQALVGLHLAYLIDVLCPTLTTTSSKQDASEDEARATKMLMAMAEKSYENAGMSWRVGVSAMMDPAALANLGPMGAAMMAKRTVPACMTVEAFMATPEMDGATVLLPTEMQVKVELWRSDLMSGLIELDTQGNITQLGIKDQPAFSPHLLLGAPPGLLTGVAMNQVVPLHGKSVLEAMFTEGGLAAPKAPSGPGGGRGGARGGMRGTGQYTRRRGIGPVHTVKLIHATDGTELEMTVQAVVKQDIGVGCSLFILMHLVTPKCGRADFRNWIWDSPVPGLISNAARRASHRRTSALTENSARGGMPRDLMSQYGPPSPPAKPAQRVLMFSDAKADVKAEKKPVPPINLPTKGIAALDVPAPEEEAMVSDKVEEFKTDGEADTDEAHSQPLKASAFANADDPSQLDVDEATAEVDNSLLRPSPPSGDLPSARKSRGRAGEARTGSAGGTRGAVKRSGTKDLAKGALSQRKRDGTSVKSGKGKNGKGIVGDDDDDADSVDSAPTGLKDGGHERIKNWITTAASTHHDSGSDNNPDEPDSEEEEEEEDLDEQRQEEDMDVEEADEEVDEAGAAVNDFKRGKRLKKLIKLLMGPQAQGPNRRLKWVSIIIVICLIITDLAMFMAFMNMVTVQTNQINDLRSSSRAVNRVMQLSISTSSLEIAYGNKTSTHLRYLGEQGVQAAIDYSMKHMETRTTQMDTYHRGIYRGFTTTRELPKAYGLRSIWDDPLLPIRVFFTSPNGTFSLVQNMSLWDAGNLFIKSARNILQNAETEYGLATNNSYAFENSTDVLFILYNGPRSISTAYQETLDGLMQQAISDSSKMNEVQLIILAVEGGLIGFTAVIVMWITTSIVVFRRFAVFSVFMVVPSGVIKTLATKAVDIEDGEEDEEGREPGEGEEGQGDAEAAAAAVAGSGNVEDWGGQKKGTGVKINFTSLATQNNKEVEKPKTFMGKLMSSLPSFMRSDNPDASRKRRLKKSVYAVLYITWPFMLWAIFVIIINIMGYMALKDISSPIAISNIVQFVSIRVNSILLFSQRYVSGQYLDSSIGYAAQNPLPAGVPNPLKTGYKKTLADDYETLRDEYDAMLYGREGSRVANKTSPHFQLAKTGIMFTQGAELMYNSRACFAQETDDCLPDTHPFYRYTRNGLDTLLKELFYSVEALLLQPAAAANMNSEHFIYTYEVGNADISGGLIALTDVYSAYVASMYASALNLHIVALAMCCALGLLFLTCILRPTLSRVTAETKRVAELLSQLPPEVDVEGMLTDALRTDRGTRDPQAELEAAAKAKEEAKIMQGQATMGGRQSRRASMDDMTNPYDNLPGKRKSIDGPPTGRRASMDAPDAAFNRNSMDMTKPVKPMPGRDSAMNMG